MHSVDELNWYKLGGVKETIERISLFDCFQDKIIYDFVMMLYKTARFTECLSPEQFIELNEWVNYMDDWADSWNR